MDGWMDGWVDGWIDRYKNSRMVGVRMHTIGLYI